MDISFNNRVQEAYDDIKERCKNDDIMKSLRRQLDIVTDAERLNVALKRKIMSNKVTYLRSLKQPKQKSKDWFSMRKRMFTASSDICNILGKSEYGGTQKSVIDKKCGFGDEFKGNLYTQHGTKYENIAIRIYESRQKTVVHELGLLSHPTIPRLGASPDGITAEGKLLEIKVPYTRILTGDIKIGYFVQVQTQMEVCDIDLCDFFECKITEYANGLSYFADEFDGFIAPEPSDLNIINVPIDRRTSNGLEKGMIGRTDIDEYFYPPFEMTSGQQYAWLKRKKKELSKCKRHMEIKFWKLQNSELNEIKRDKEWWESNKVEDKIKETWERVVHVQRFGTDKINL